jgi:hypothetical protein
MGRILTFTPLALRRETPVTEGLNPAQSVCLLSLRWWVADLRGGGDPTTRMRHALAMAGAGPVAAESLDQFMRVLARGARRQIEVHAPHCPCLAADERLLLRAAALAQAAQPRAAAETLAGSLLGPQAASLALGPLGGLGMALARAGLHFPGQDSAGHESAEQADAAAPQTLH